VKPEKVATRLEELSALAVTYASEKASDGETAASTYYLGKAAGYRVAATKVRTEADR
jgi:hypothetical protein